MLRLLIKLILCYMFPTCAMFYLLIKISSISTQNNQ